MKIETIKISKEFSSRSGGVWLGMEGSVGEDEDKIQAYKDGNELLEKAFMVLNPQISWNEQAPQVINKEAERIEIAIDNCTSKEELLLIQTDAIKHGLVKEYLSKQKQLSQ